MQLRPKKPRPRPNANQSEKTLLTVREPIKKNPQLLTVIETMGILGISLSTLQRKQKDTPNFPQSFYLKNDKRRKFFNRQEVERWKAEHSAKAEQKEERSLLTSKEVIGAIEPATEVISPDLLEKKTPNQIPLQKD